MLNRRLLQATTSAARVPVRALATAASPAAASSSASTSAARRRDKLDDGLTFDDFVSGEPVERVVLGNTSQPRLPSFLKHPIATGASYNAIKKDLRGLGLHTVCEEAKCPNIGECWGGAKGEATATIMLMGDQCTRGCRFCSVKTARAPPPLDIHEPENTAEAISRWGLGYIVLTSVDRDDLADGGAAHIASTISKIKQKAPSILVEALTPDFAGKGEAAIAAVATSGLDVFAHNVETVERCTPFVRDRRAGFEQSLDVLRTAKRAAREAGKELLTKSSIMLGVGEQEDELVDALRRLREADVDVVTFGQYMRPTKKHMKVDRYVQPEEFARWKEVAEGMGFLYVASGPLVRSSYKAGEFFIENVLKKRRADAAQRALGQVAAEGDVADASASAVGN
ncbi:hypothetical protein Q5752_003686 [Cryptotrichosporon argae]